jgi:hypothetical protein
LAELLHQLGWVHSALYDDGGITDLCVDELTDSLPGKKETGITVISHSK